MCSFRKRGRRKQARSPFEKERKKRLDRKLSVLWWLMGCRFGGRGVCLNMHSPYVLLPPYRPVNEDGSAFLRSVLTDSAPIFLSESCFPHSLKQPFKLPVVWLIPVSSLKLNILFSTVYFYLSLPRSSVPPRFLISHSELWEWKSTQIYECCPLSVL